MAPSSGLVFESNSTVILLRWAMISNTTEKEGEKREALVKPEGGEGNYDSISRNTIL
jgi:hypothetical protein